MSAIATSTDITFKGKLKIGDSTSTKSVKDLSGDNFENGEGVDTFGKKLAAVYGSDVGIVKATVQNNTEYDID